MYKHFFLTVHEVKKKLKLLGIRPKKSLGQNFLIGKETLLNIIQKINNVPSKNILEIGPGLGALTHSLRRQKPSSSLKLVEIDETLFKYWKSQGFNVINKNALELNLSEVSSNFILGNLPYSVASRLFIHLSIQEERKDFMLFMFQKEVAKRILSEKKKKSYGLLSVIAQVFWDVEFVTEAVPRDFYPRPRVSGWVLFFKRKSVALKTPGLFLKFVRCAFSHRRKFLAKNLKLYFLSCEFKSFRSFRRFKKSSETLMSDEFMVDCEKFLNNLSLHEKIRAEEVSPKEYLEIFNKIHRFSN